MNILSWREENIGKNGILISPYDHRPPYELFFSSRLELYLGLLGSLPLPIPWILSLQQVDLEVTVPTIGPDCPICPNKYLPNLLDDEEDRKMPGRLPCGHHLCEECIHRLAWEADATDSVLCPFCRCSHYHVPNAQGGSPEDILNRGMWIALDVFTRLHQDDFQDMDAVTRWSQDFPALSYDVPEEDKQDAICHSAQSWLDMGGRGVFSRQLAERVYNESNMEFYGSSCEASWRPSSSSVKAVIVPIGRGIHPPGI